MTHYDDIIMPKCARFGSRTTPTVAVDQIFFDSGYDATNARWSQYLRTLTLDYLKQNIEFEEIARIFLSLGGRANSFLARDWSDWNTTQGKMEEGAESTLTHTDQPLRNTVTGASSGDGTTTTFQMIKAYSAGSASHQRIIQKPEAATVKIGKGGALQTLTTDYTFDAATGIVTFAVAPGNGIECSWGGAFYVPVRFASEQLPIGLETNILQSADQIELQEIRL